MTLIEAMLKTAGPDKRLPCAAAMALGERHGVSPAEVGAAANQLGVRVTRCQLGLFGYGKPHTPEDKRLESRESYAPALIAALEEWRGKRLPCAEAWRIAEASSVDRLTVGSAADSVRAKIIDCQLCCFQRCR